MTSTKDRLDELCFEPYTGIDPVHHFPNGTRVSAAVNSMGGKVYLVVQHTTIEDEETNPRFDLHHSPVPIDVVVAALGRAGFGVMRLPHGTREVMNKEDALNSLHWQLLNDIFNLRHRVEQLKELAQKEHARADKNFLDLQGDVTKARTHVRETIIRFLRHSAGVEVGTLLNPSGRELIATVAQWIENELDEKWATAQGESGPLMQ